MKRLFSILLALLMIMCFVGCKDVTPETNLDDDTPTDTTPTTPSVPETDDEEKIIINLPELPEPEGSDPFINLTELKIDELNRIKINSENKTMTAIRYFDDDDPYFVEYSYSYKIVDEKINVYLVITKVLDLESRELLSVQDYCDRKKVNNEEYCRRDLEDYFSFYNMYVGTDEWSDIDWLDAIDDWNEIYGTDFTVEEFIPENFDEILKRTLNSDVLKNGTLEEQLDIKKQAEVVRQFVFELSDIGFEESKAKVKIEGLYDESKNWYEQINGCFEGSITESNGEISCFPSYLSLNIDKYSYFFVESVDENRITTTYWVGNEKAIQYFDYTISGTGKDAVISIVVADDTILELTWEPMSKLSIYL